MKRVFLFILLSLALNLSNARQNTDYFSLLYSEPPSYSNQFITYWDNDMFLRTDYYFTNGIAFEYISDRLKYRRIERFLKTPFVLNNKTYSLVFRQNMFTPEKMYNSDIQENDRPYAGYLTAEYKLISENRSRRFTSSLTIGILGEYSFAGSTQNLVHSMDHLNVAQGWDYQVSSAPIINLSYGHEQKLVQNQVFDIQYGITGRLGSLYTDIAGDATIRIGKRNSSFDFTSGSNKNMFESYFYISGGGKVSFYDATLQGSILTYNPSQYYLTNSERHLFISQFSTGIVLSYKFLRVRGSITGISPEFKGGKTHRWGEVSIGISF